MDLLKGMEVFARVVEAESFAKAAETLGLSRPMASKYVQQLEEELGIRLLNRTTRTMALTEAGRSFHLRCQEILLQVDEAISEATNLQVEPRGRLRINAPVSFGRVHLARAVAAFQTQYPEITVDLSLNDRFVDIVDEGFDLAIRIGRLEDSSLVSRRLAPCRMTVCASPRYLAARGNAQDAA